MYFFMSLKRGLNMISVPLKPKKPYTGRSLMELLGATTVIGLEADTQQFVGFTADAPDNGFPIEGGTGYIVNVPEQKSVSFVGAAWMNLSSVAAAPSPSAIEGAWAFVISGRFGETRTDGYRVTVRNVRTNAVTGDFVRTGYFAAAFADWSRTSVVETGDRLEITVSDTFGTVVSGPDLYTVTPAAIEQAFLRVRLQQLVAPRVNLLLQNYPNPFNPETWIPYQLSTAAYVTITIYDAQGYIVRLLDSVNRLPVSITIVLALHIGMVAMNTMKRLLRDSISIRFMCLTKRDIKLMGIVIFQQPVGCWY